MKKTEILNGVNGSSILLEHLLDAQQMNGKCGLYAKVTIEPNGELGHHEHHGETETYYILSGKGLYEEDGVKTEVSAGDVLFCKDGSGHGIATVGEQALVFMALIINA